MEISEIIDKKLIIIIDNSKHAYIINSNFTELILEMSEEFNFIRIIFNPLTNQFISLTFSSFLQFWNLEHNNVDITRFAKLPVCNPNSLVLASELFYDLNILVTYDEQNNLKMWNAKNFRHIQTINKFIKR